MFLNFKSPVKTCQSHVTCIYLFLCHSIKNFYLKKAFPGISLRYWEAQCTGAELYSQNYHQSVSGKVSWNDTKKPAFNGQGNGVSPSSANCI